MNKISQQIVPVILCGGSGTRLWPLSRAGFPKQFLVLSGTTSLFQQAIQRVNAIGADDILVGDTLIVTGSELGVTLKFEGNGVDEIATVTSIIGDKAPALKVGDVIVRIDPRYFRPTEVETLLGDPTKAKEKLGWVPEITVQEMCVEMVASDLVQAKKQALLKQHGYKVNVSFE